MQSMVIDDQVRACLVLSDQGRYDDAIFALVEGAKESMALHDGWVDGGLRDALSDVFRRVITLAETYDRLEKYDDAYIRMFKLEQGIRQWNDGVPNAYRVGFTPEQQEMFNRLNSSGDLFDEI